jgi:UDP-N-acetylglucosamine acyltransferase
MIASGAPAKLYGPNVVGLRRLGMPTVNIQALKRSYRIIFRSGLSLKEAVERVRAEVEPFPEVETLLAFMTAPSKRGVTRDTV